jgi:glutathione S-transferase
MPGPVPDPDDHAHALRDQAHHGPGPRPRGAGRLRVGDDALRRLVTIPISHYCEKARWALERAGLTYREERHVQGAHLLASKRAGGHGTTPVLITEHGTFAGSEWIVRYADLHLDPRDRLFTGGPAVEALARRLDAGLGPDGRRLIYAHMLPRPELMLAYNNQGVPAWEAKALTALYAVARRWARRRLEIRGLDSDRAKVLTEFDAIAARLADGRPYLTGERFTAADLTFASLAAAVVLPPEYGVPLPQPEDLPGPVRAEVERFRAHPAGAYALGLFEKRRANAFRHHTES